MIVVIALIGVGLFAMPVKADDLALATIDVRAAKPKLPHVCNMASQILSGAAQRITLMRSSPLQSRGCCMSPEKLAVLRTLAIRPSSSLAASLLPTVISLEQGGLVTNTPTGWIATAKGCEVLEGQRLAGIK
jgi:hypothetical protein